MIFRILKNLMSRRTVCVVLCGVCFLLITPGKGLSQGFYLFGRNKVQYMNFNWHILDTPHFEIYYYPEMQTLAERGAYFAEEAYSDFSKKFNIHIDRKIPLIFYSSHLHFQQTNVTPGYIPEGVGGFFEFLKGRVVVPSDGSITRFRHVIRHELVHVFTHSKVFQVSKNHKQLFKGGIPLWLIEGLAECWSGPWNGQAEMVLRDAVISGYIVPLSQMYRIEGTFLMYKEGEQFLRYYEEKYGSEKILLLLENMWRGESFEKVLVRVTGVSFKKIDEEWTYHLKKRYYPIIQREDVPSMAAEKLTDFGYNSNPVFYSEHGKDYMVFISNRTGYTNIYMKSLDENFKNKSLEILVKGERSAEFESFHVFRSKINLNSDGMLAFVSKRGGQDALNLYDIPNRRIKKHFVFKNVVSLSSPCWSPDKQMVALTGINLDGNSDIYLINVSNGKINQITSDYYDDRDPSWSPNGRYVAFSSDRKLDKPEDGYNLFALDFHEQNIQQLTYGDHNDYAPVWSSDGKYLAYTSDKGGATNIWLLKSNLSEEFDSQLFASTAPGNSKSGNPLQSLIFKNVQQNPVGSSKQVTFITTGIFDPAWTSKGDLLFSSFENFNFQIQRLTLNLTADSKTEFVENVPASTNHQLWVPQQIQGEYKASTKPYKKRYNLDFVLGQIAQHPYYGTSGGSIFAISDMLGNDYYTILLFNNAQRRSDFMGSFNLALSRYAQGKRTNFVYGLYNLDYRWYNRFEGIFDKSEYGGFFGIEYPLSVFSRIEVTSNFSHVYKQFAEFNKNTRQSLLLSNYITYIKDNSLWVLTGPIDGHRYFFSLGHTSDLRYRNVGYYTVAFDYRYYYRLSFRSAYAVRVMNLYRSGKDIERMYMGGSWDLRGYRRFSLWGKKLSLVSQELRFPLLDQFSLVFPKAAISLTQVRGALFFDAGNAWENKLDEVLGSFGGGIRFNIGFVVIRFDMGKLIENHFSKLSKGLFTQFYFGWDF